MIVDRIIDNLALAIHAPEQTLRLATLCLVSEGYLIIEDFPGVGKTTLAKALARSVGCSFSRIQFTPDLLPSDVTGVNMFSQQTGEFEFRPGPVFTNLLLIDEINRASPKTQAALLESMQELQVTVDGTSYELAPPFMVMATQNPIEYESTYALPEAELDRFTLRISIGYPPLLEEAQMIDEQSQTTPLDDLQAVVTAEDVLGAIADARAIYVDRSLAEYVVTIMHLGASPRAGITLLKVAKARGARRTSRPRHAGGREGRRSPGAGPPFDTRSGSSGKRRRARTARRRARRTDTRSCLTGCADEAGFRVEPVRAGPARGRAALEGRRDHADRQRPVRASARRLDLPRRLAVRL